MDLGGAYGGAKAGAAFDPITFVQRPQVILRAVCLVSTDNDICINYVSVEFLNHFASAASDSLLLIFRVAHGLNFC